MPQCGCIRDFDLSHRESGTYHLGLKFGELYAILAKGLTIRKRVAKIQA